jgi:hypothetical protein
MDWDSIKDSGSGEKIDFYKINPGNKNQIRIVGKPSSIDVHWEKGVDGQPKKVLCPGRNCPICKAGHNPTIRYQIQVMDRADNNTIKVLEGGPAIFNQIKTYAKDEDYGDPTKYDFKINKEGSGRDTKYTLLPSPKKSDFKDEEKEIIANCKPLSEINKVKTVEEILQMGLEVLATNNFNDLNVDFGETNTAGNGDSGSDNDDDDWGNL